MQYIENLEAFLFLRGVKYGIWGFLFVGGGGFCRFRCFFAFYCALRVAHSTEILFWSVRNPDIFLTLEKKLSLQFLVWVMFNC